MYVFVPILMVFIAVVTSAPRCSKDRQPDTKDCIVSYMADSVDDIESTVNSSQSSTTGSITSKGTGTEADVSTASTTFKCGNHKHDNCLKGKINCSEEEEDGKSEGDSTDATVDYDVSNYNSKSGRSDSESESDRRDGNKDVNSSIRRRKRSTSNSSKRSTSERKRSTTEVVRRSKSQLYVQGETETTDGDGLLVRPPIGSYRPTEEHNYSSEAFARSARRSIQLARGSANNTGRSDRNDDSKGKDQRTEPDKNETTTHGEGTDRYSDSSDECEKSNTQSDFLVGQEIEVITSTMKRKIDGSPYTEEEIINAAVKRRQNQTWRRVSIDGRQTFVLFDDDTKQFITIPLKLYRNADGTYCAQNCHCERCTPHEGVIPKQLCEWNCTCEHCLQPEHKEKESINGSTIRKLLDSQQVWMSVNINGDPTVLLYNWAGTLVQTIPMMKEPTESGYVCPKYCACPEWHSDKMILERTSTPNGEECMEITTQEDFEKAETNWAIMTSRLIEASERLGLKHRLCCKFTDDEMLLRRDEDEQEKYPDRWQQLCCRWIRRRDASPNSQPETPIDSDGEDISQIRQMKERQQSLIEELAETEARVKEQFGTKNEQDDDSSSMNTMDWEDGKSLTGPRRRLSRIPVRLEPSTGKKNSIKLMQNVHQSPAKLEPLQKPRRSQRILDKELMYCASRICQLKKNKDRDDMIHHMKVLRKYQELKDKEREVIDKD